MKQIKQLPQKWVTRRLYKPPNPKTQKIQHRGTKQCYNRKGIENLQHYEKVGSTKNKMLQDGRKTPARSTIKTQHQGQQKRH